MPEEICCRICWNTEGWQRPSGAAALMESGGAYTAEHGFGHEEWLFNFAWRDREGYKYGFLQPINRNLAKYAGRTLDIFLYTISPTGWFFVALIRNCKVLKPQERSSAYSLYQREGWLEGMREHVRQVQGDEEVLEDEAPFLFNVRFARQDVEFFDPLVGVPEGHKARLFPRYQTFRGGMGHVATRSGAAPRRARSAALTPKSTAVRTRRASAETTYDPTHDRLQNALVEYLRKRHGVDAVVAELGYVDVQLAVDGKLTFFEIKGHHTVRQCIRSALGQLMEYAYWPPAANPDRLVIVGESKLDQSGREYLNLLRNRWGLPVYYATFNLVRNELGEYA